MKKLIHVLIFLIFFPLISIALDKSGGDAPSGKATPSDATSATEMCPLYEKDQADKMKSACPMITDQDFDEALSSCREGQRKATPACRAAYGNMSQQLSNLRSRYEEYLRAQAAARSAAAAASDPFGDDFGGGMPSISSQEQVSLAAYYDEATRTMGLLNDVKIASECGPGVTMYSLLPLVSFYNPTAAYAIGAGASIFSQVSDLFKTKKLSILEKTSLCEANQYFRQARSNGCQSIVFSDQQARDKVSTAEKNRRDQISKGKNTKLYKLLKANQNFKDKIAALNKLADSDNSADLAAEALTSLNAMLANMNCTDAKAAPICNDLKKAIPLLSQGPLVSFDDPENKRKATILTLSRLSQMRDLAVIAKKPDEWPKSRQNLYFQKGVPFYLTGEDSELAFSGMDAWSEEILPQQSSVFTSNRNPAEAADNAAIQIKSALDKFPQNIPTPSNVKQFCAATSCIWGSAKPVEQLDDEALVLDGKKSILQQIAEGSKKTQNQWSPLSVQTSDEIINGGKGKYQSWDTNVRSFDSRLSKLASTCSKETSTCKISCYGPLTRLEKTTGSIEETGSGTKSNTPSPTPAPKAPSKTQDGSTVN